VRNPVPITVRCECGETVSVDLGDEVSCTCGRRYDTSKLAPDQFGTVRAAQARMRLYIQVGIIFIVAITVLTALKWGIKGAAVGGPVAALIWFRFLGKWYKRRWLKDTGDRPSLQLEAE
jgi:hypothetical protein